MIAIAHAESGFNCGATNTANRNGTVDRGLFQINSVHNFTGDYFDCQTNIEMAHKVWLSQGYDAWVVYQTGKHLGFKAK
jgi:hypothetical protein